VAEIIVGADVNADANVNVLILAQKKREDVIVKDFGTAVMIHAAKNNIITITITMEIADIISLAGIRYSGSRLSWVLGLYPAFFRRFVVSHTFKRRLAYTLFLRRHIFKCTNHWLNPSRIGISLQVIYGATGNFHAMLFKFRDTYSERNMVRDNKLIIIIILRQY